MRCEVFTAFCILGALSLIGVFLRLVVIVFYFVAFLFEFEFAFDIPLD